MLDHGGNLGRIALTTPWPHSPRTPRECSILRRIEINPLPLVLSYLHHRANNPSSTRVSHILSTTMHDDPPPIVFEPRKRMRKTIASRDIPEEYARGKRYLCTRRMRHLIVTRESSIELRNWPALRERRRSRESPIIRALSSSLISFSRRNHPRREHPSCSLPFFCRSFVRFYPLLPPS